MFHIKKKNQRELMGFIERLEDESENYKRKSLDERFVG